MTDPQANTQQDDSAVSDDNTQSTNSLAMTNTRVFQDLVQSFTAKQAELKEIKKMIKDAEKDVPMELEDIQLALKDLRAQVKEQKEEHLRSLLENNVEYVENRERVQMLKEEMAEVKLELFSRAQNESREHGDLDKKLVVSEGEFRLQTQKEVVVYLNGKVVK